MQELLLDDSLMEWVNIGKKHGTSRRGRRDIQLAPLKLKATNGTCSDIIVNVISVTYTLLKNVPINIVKSEGYSSHEELVESLQRFYPGVALDDEFTLVEWEETE